MSYILDALRKADAERERGTVPGIHAQPIFAGAPQASARRTTAPWVWASIAATVVIAIAVLLWWLFSRGAAEPVPAPAAAVAPIATPAAPSMPLPQAPLPTAPAAAVKPAIEAAPPVRKPAVAAAPKPAMAETRSASSASAATAKAEPKPASENRVYAQNELPDDIRRQLPAIAIGGSMYSAKKADRLLIINGQVLHEGDAVAPGLVLEQIKLKAAVLAFKGYRYGIAF